MSATRPLAIVTGASTGIGFELAKRCAKEGYDLLIAADEPAIEQAANPFVAAAPRLKLFRPTSRQPKAWTSSMRPRRAVRWMPSSQTPGAASATRSWIRILQRPGASSIPTSPDGLSDPQGRKRMRRRNAGKILITGSIAGFTPGSFQAVYNGTKAFLNSFSFALREELKDTKVTVTCLMPGATETEFFKRAEMMDTAVGTTEKDDAADVANSGFDAMMKGEGDVVSRSQEQGPVCRGQRDAGRRSCKPASQDGRTRYRKKMIGASGEVGVH